jgi:hypothetical protein
MRIMPEVIPFPVKKRGLSEIIERLIEIGKVLHIPDAEILLACSDFHELIAFSRKYNQSLNWIVFGNPDEMIVTSYRAKSDDK